MRQIINKDDSIYNMLDISHATMMRNETASDFDPYCQNWYQNLINKATSFCWYQIDWICIGYLGQTVAFVLEVAAYDSVLHPATVWPSESCIRVYRCQCGNETLTQTDQI